MIIAVNILAITCKSSRDLNLSLHNFILLQTEALQPLHAAED